MRGAHQLIIGFLFLTGVSFSQANLVPNGDFEVFEQCPQDISHKLKAGHVLIPHWYTPTKGSPDYYNACSESVKARTGNNWIGNKEAEDGKAYVGLLIEDDVREYLQVKLIEPLKAGHTYDLEMMVARASNTNFASENIQILFTRDSIHKNAYENIYAKPSFSIGDDIPGALMDGWQTYHGKYTASGGEQYLTLGNFSNLKGRQKVKGHGDYYYCYYFIDAVSVIEKYDFSEQIDAPNNQYHLQSNDNLVWNGGFEYTDYCRSPVSRWPIEANTFLMPFWQNLGTGTADIMVNCSMDGEKFFDRKLLKEPAYTGNGKAGFVAFHEYNDTLGRLYSEYLLGNLKEPLKKGESYHIGFQVKSARFSEYAIKNIGLRFYQEIPLKSGHNQLQDSSHIPYPLKHEIAYHDGWVKISGKYIAQGGEKHIAIGLFGDAKPKKHRNFLGGEIRAKDRSSFLIFPYAYYYVDNVAVSPDSLSVNTLFEDEPVNNVVFLIDASASMGEDGKLDDALTAYKELLRYLRPEDKISLVAFGSKTKVLFKDLSAKNYKEFDEAVETFQAKGSSNFKEGLKVGADLSEELKFDLGNNKLIVLTDGKYNALDQENTFKKLGKAGIDTYVVLIGEDAEGKNFNNLPEEARVHVEHHQNSIAIQDLITILRGND